MLSEDALNTCCLHIYLVSRVDLVFSSCGCVVQSVNVDVLIVCVAVFVVYCILLSCVDIV